MYKLSSFRIYLGSSIPWIDVRIYVVSKSYAKNGNGNKYLRSRELEQKGSV
jgi:hypothetical protein